MDPIGAIDTTLTIVGRLKKLSETISNAEFKSLLAELSNNLADAKLEIATLKAQNLELYSENQRLKTEEFSKKPTIKTGCYQFDGDDTLYCIACYEKQKRKSPAFDWESIAMVCSVCNKSVPI